MLPSRSRTVHSAYTIILLLCLVNQPLFASKQPAVDVVDKIIAADLVPSAAVDLPSPSLTRGIKLRSELTRKPKRAFQDNYQLKLSVDLKSKAEYRLERELINHHQQQMLQGVAQSGPDSRYLFYRYLANYLSINGDLDYRLRLASLLSKKSKLVQYSAERAGVTKVDQLIDLNEKMEINQGEIFQLQRSRTHLMKQLNEVLGQKLNISTDTKLTDKGVIGVGGIEAFLTSFKTQERLEHIFAREQIRLNIIEGEAKLERARTVRTFESLHFGVAREYELKRSKEGVESEERDSSVMVQLTLAMPMQNSYNVSSKLANHRIKKVEIIREKERVRRQLESVKEELAGMIGLYQQMKSSHYAKSLHKYRRSVRKMRGQTPATLISLREKLLSYQYRLEHLEAKVRIKYIELLELGSFFLSHPQHNFLKGV
jgi:hypothetical protein